MENFFLSQTTVMQLIIELIKLLTYQYSKEKR